MKYLSSKKGFTLIELLVVISIIGLLSSIVLASLSVAREKARDSKRKQDMEQYKIALELYYSDNGNYFLNTTGDTRWPGFGYTDCDNTYSSYYFSNSINETLVSRGYLGGRIIGPTGLCTEYVLESRPTGAWKSSNTWYSIYTKLERPTSQDAQIFLDRECNASPYTDERGYNWCVVMFK